ncbi:MAG: transcription antitermination factor NusB [Halobacteriovoraceae bacterium]|nr:transcription antitermination factor NusB [Halobacteriovoraceae bacterium]MBT5094214.1 transcription antitermination factor NusB [Halobacteriovoraceae bacterium]
MINKTLARRYAFQFLYHFQLPEFSEYRNQLCDLDPSEYRDIIDEGLNLFDQSISEVDEEVSGDPLSNQERDYSIKLILGILENEESLKEKISAHLRKTSLEKIENVEKTILLVGVYEILYVDDVPPKVSLSEAIKIAQEFGTEQSYAFVNGVLDNFVK